MLQQTQVATVIPYYDRFLRAFPSVNDLARARFERVAAQWSGLGYYRRARHLHRAARKIMSDFARRFPQTYEQARTLPGVGHYTACAVLSIAFGRPLAVLDGNVARVVARLYALRGNLHQAKFRREVERRLAELLSPRRPGDFNQAMMELGQTVCLPRAPRCALCPLRRRCVAFSRGEPESYPVPRPRRAAEPTHMAVAVISKNGKVALVRGLDDGLLSDLWNFPAAFGRNSREALQRLKLKLDSLGAPSLHQTRRLGTTRHRITFRTISAEAYEFSGAADAAPFRWFTWPKLDTAAVSQLARKIALVASERKWE